MKKQNRGLSGRIKKAGLNLEQGGVELEQQKSVKEVVEGVKKSLELGAQEKEAEKAGAKIADALGLGKDKKEQLKVSGIEKHLQDVVWGIHRECPATFSESLLLNRLIEVLIKSANRRLSYVPSVEDITLFVSNLQNGFVVLESDEEGVVYYYAQKEKEGRAIINVKNILSQKEIEDEDILKVFSSKDIKIDPSVIDKKYLNSLGMDTI